MEPAPVPVLVPVLESHDETHEQHGPGYKTVSHGNEIIHQYPVEVSQFLQLDHDIKSVHASIHPSQLQHSIPPVHSKPDEPADLIVKEPDAHSPGHVSVGVGSGIPHTQTNGDENHSPYGGDAGSGGHYHTSSYGHGVPHIYPTHSYYRRPSKLIHLLKTWPLLLHKTMRHRKPIWPLFRPYRPRIKHNHHHYF